VSKKQKDGLITAIEIIVEVLGMVLLFLPMFKKKGK